MGFLKGGDVVDCETLVGEEVGFFFGDEGLNVGEGNAFFLFFWIRLIRILIL